MDQEETIMNCDYLQECLDAVNNYEMKILTVAFMLLLNYLDTLPKLYNYESNSWFHLTLHNS